MLHTKQNQTVTATPAVGNQEVINTCLEQLRRLTATVNERVSVLTKQLQPVLADTSNTPECDRTTELTIDKCQIRNSPLSAELIDIAYIAESTLHKIDYIFENIQVRELEPHPTCDAREQVNKYCGTNA